MIYLLIIICFAPFLYMVRFEVFNIPTTLLEMIICLGLVITVIMYLMKIKKKLIFPEKKLMLPIIFLIISGLIGILVSPNKIVALGLFKALLIDPIIFFWLILNYIETENQINILIKAIIASGVFVSVFAVWQKITGDLTPDGRALGIYIYEPLASPNFLALYLAPIAVLTFGYGLMDKIKQNLAKIIYCTFSFIIIIIAIYFSGSRAGLGAVIVGIIIYVSLKYWKKIVFSKISISIFTLLILISVYFGWQFVKPNWSLDLEEGSRISTSNNIRWEIWTTTVKDILPHKNNWLYGVGLGNYQNYFTVLTQNRVNYPEWISPWAVSPHNLFITFWVNLGLLGIVSIFWIMIKFYYYARNNQKYAIIFLTLMLVIIVQGMLDTPYWKNDLSVFFWVIFGLVYVLSVRKE